jgi:succinoglycan biosynthesis transport protein ExoP
MTIDKLGLQQDGGREATTETQSFSPRRWFARTQSTLIGAAVRLFRSPPSAPPADPKGADESVAQSNAIDAFLGSVTVEPVRASRLVDIKFRSADPSFAARAINALADTYIEQHLEFKFLASQEASDWLGKRLAEQRKAVEDSEMAVQRYRERSDAVSLEERQNIVVQKLADLNAAVTRAKTDLIQREALYTQLNLMAADSSALAGFPPILANAYIQQLKTELAQLQAQQAQLGEQLGERHPDMIKVSLAVQSTQAKLKTEIANVVQSLRSEYLAARSQEQSLVAALEAQKQEALDLNRKAIDYGVLQRDAMSNRQMFETLMQRTKEMGISSELRTSNIRVVDKAEVPQTPVSPNKRHDIMMALFSATVLALGLVFLFERLDNRITLPSELPDRLGLALLGLVPAVPLKASHGSPLINNGVPQHFSEAFRAVRTNVLFSSTQQGARTIVVTSAAPSEGKTVVASNLAIALAQTGLSVLLVDADMRRPRIHEVFDQSQQPGLSNVIVGNVDLDQAVRPSEIPGLSLLPAGPNPPNPAELLASTPCRELLERLGKRFDWIVIDSPPVLAVTDAAVLSHVASRALFVIAADMTSRPAVQAAIGQLEAAGAKFLGGVLNRANIQGNRYYYSQYYQREYKPSHAN